MWFIDYSCLSFLCFVFFSKTTTSFEPLIQICNDFKMLTKFFWRKTLISFCLIFYISLSTDDPISNVSPDKSKWRDLNGCLFMTADGSFINNEWMWSEETKLQCEFVHYSEEESINLLGRRMIVMIGDSQTRHFLSAIARSLGGDMKSGYWKRDGDEFMTSLGGRIVWPFFTKFSSELVDDGNTGLRAAVSSLPLADFYIINIGHWNAIMREDNLSFPSINSMVNKFGESVPAITQELLRMRSLELPPFLERSKRCLHPFIIWATPNHIIPELYRKAYSDRQDRPERVEAINDYLVNVSGLFDSEGPALLLDMNKISRLGGRTWVSDDLIHGTEEFFKLCWSLLANVINTCDKLCSL